MRKTEQKSTLWMMACAMLAVVCCIGCGQALSEDQAASKADAKVAKTIELKVEATVAAKDEAKAEKKTKAKRSAEKKVEAKEATDAETPEVDFEALQSQYEAREKATLERLRKDPEWQGTHQEVAVIEPVPGSGSDAVYNFCLNVDGNLLVGCGGNRQTRTRDPKNPRGYTVKEVSEPCEIRVIRPDGQLVTKWELPSKPQAICVHRDGTIFVGGDGRLLKLSQQGKVLAAIDWPAMDEPEEVVEEVAEEAKDEPEDDAVEEEPAEKKSVLKALTEALLGRGSSGAPEPSEEQKKAMKEMARQQARAINGIAVTDQDIFVACRATQGYGFVVWRLDHDLQNAKQVVDGLRGCCGQMDVQARDGEIWVPENGRHRVVRYDRDGKELASFGKSGRSKPEQFGGCCEPKNLCFGPEGSVYASESGTPMIVKRFSPKGEFLGVVGMPSFQTGCVRVPIEVSSDGDRVYILNAEGNTIHVLADKRRAPTHEQVATIKLPEEYPYNMLHTICLSPEGNLLVAVGGEQVSYTTGPNGREAKVASKQPAILAINPEGKLLATWEVDIKPQAFDVAEDGTVFVGGEGRLARLGKDGKVQQVADSPHVAGLPPVPEEPKKPAESKQETEEDKKARQAKIEAVREKMKKVMEPLQKAMAERTAAKDDPKAQAAAAEKYNKAMQEYMAINQELRELTTTPEVLAAQKRAAAMKKRMVRSVAATGDDVFVCCPAATGYGFDVWRTDRDFGPGKKIVTGLRGCCGNMYIQAHDGEVWVAENARKRVVRYDRDGKELASWGSSDRKAIEGFGSCCNPMCIRIGPDGVVYTAEASLGRIKRYSPEGEFLGMVATAEIVPGCKHVPIGITADAGRVYMLDLTRSHVLVMEPIKTEAVAKAGAKPAAETGAETAIPPETSVAVPGN